METAASDSGDRNEGDQRVDRSPGDQRSDRLLAWGALVVAVLVRVLFLADKPFWRDEAWVATLVDEPMRAAAEGRAAPLGFLFATHVASGLPWLPAEVAYRLLPLAAGLALLPALARFATVLGASRRTGLLAMWLAAGLQPLVYYSRELKSYGFDALLAVLAPLAGLLAFGVAAGSTGARVAFAAVVVAAPWLSFAGIFAVGAVFAWGWLVWWWKGDAAHRRAWLACSAAFAASFLAVYALALGNQAGDAWMHAYWKAALAQDDSLSLPLRFLVAVVRYADVSTAYLFGEFRPVVLALSALGVWTWPRAQRGYLVFQYAATAAVCAVAVVTDHYLLASGRMLLVAAPIPLLWTAQGLHVTGRMLGRRVGRRLGAAIVVGLPVVAALTWSAQSVRHRVAPYRTDGTTFFRYDVLHDVDRVIGAGLPMIRAGEPVLIARRCTYAFRFYNRGRWPEVTTCPREDGKCDAVGRRWVKDLRGKGWILMTDEDVRTFATLLQREGGAYRVRASARGVTLWQVEGKDRSAGKKKRVTG